MDRFISALDDMQAAFTVVGTLHSQHVMPQDQFCHSIIEFK